MRLWQFGVRIHTNRAIVLYHVLVQQLFIGYLSVIWDVIVYYEVVRRQSGKLILLKPCEPIFQSCRLLLPLGEQQLLDFAQLVEDLIKRSLEDKFLLLLYCRTTEALVVHLQCSFQLSLWQYLRTPNQIIFCFCLFLANHPPYSLFQRLLYQMAVIAQLHSCLSQPLLALARHDNTKGKCKKSCNLRVDFEAIKVDRWRKAHFSKIFDTARPHFERILQCDSLLFALAFRLDTESIEFGDTINLLLAFPLGRRFHSFLILDSHGANIHDLIPLGQLYNLKAIGSSPYEIEFHLGLSHEILPKGNRLRASHIGVLRDQLDGVLYFGDCWKFEVHGPVVI